MPKINVISADGTVTTQDATHDFLAVHVHEGLIHEAVRRYQASLRQGTHDTKTRSEVRGGGRKPWRQKGTGRARAGTIRSPLWKGGGIVFGPHPRDYSFDIPKKQRRRALYASLTFKAEAGQLFVLDTTGFSDPRTKDAVALLEKAGLADRKVTLAVTREEAAAAKSFRNLPEVSVVEAEGLNPFFVLNNEALVMSSKAFELLTEGASSNE